MKLKLERSFHLEKINNSFGNPNSISFQNNKLLLTFSRNTIALLSYENFGLIRTNIGLGYGRYKFREPVYGLLDKELFICDWHNHRVVIFSEDFKYKNEFGRFGFLEKRINFINYLMRLIKFLFHQSFIGLYTRSHFPYKNEKSLLSSIKKHSLPLFFRNIHYFFSLDPDNFSKSILGDNFNLQKPNGFAKYKNFFVITEKNRRCVTIFYKKGTKFSFVKRFNKIGNNYFGRLGNVQIKNRKILFCDEEKCNVHLYNIETCKSQTINLSFIKNFKPFSAVQIKTNFLGVISYNKFLLFDLLESKVVSEIKLNAEFHGIDYIDEKNTVLLVDRLNSIIFEYIIK